MPAGTVAVVGTFMPSGRFWESRHTSLYRDSLNLGPPGMRVPYALGKIVGMDGDHKC
jgi:hypothetical protein